MHYLLLSDSTIYFAFYSSIWHIRNTIATPLVTALYHNPNGGNLETYSTTLFHDGHVIDHGTGIGICRRISVE